MRYRDRSSAIIAAARSASPGSIGRQAGVLSRAELAAAFGAGA